MDAQGTRIVELQGVMIDERTRIEAAGVKLQRIRARLVRVVEEVWDRTAGILIDTTILIVEAIEAVESPTREDTP